MKSALATLVLVGFAWAAHAEGGPAPTAPAGGLEVPELEYDADKVERGATVRHSFVLNNIGTAELSNGSQIKNEQAFSALDKLTRVALELIITKLSGILE